MLKHQKPKKVKYDGMDLISLFIKVRWRPDLVSKLQSFKAFKFGNNREKREDFIYYIESLQSNENNRKIFTDCKIPLPDLLRRGRRRGDWAVPVLPLCLYWRGRAASVWQEIVTSTWVTTRRNIDLLGHRDKWRIQILSIFLFGIEILILVSSL